MKLIPVKRCTLLTSLTPEEVMQLLDDNVDPRDRPELDFSFQWKGWSYSSDGKPYQGLVIGNEFTIFHTTSKWGRGPSGPEAVGEVRKEGTYTAIGLTIQPFPMESLGMEIWVGAAGLMTAVSLGMTIHDYWADTPINVLRLIAFTLPWVIYMVIRASYSVSSSDFVDLLCELLEAQEEKDSVH